MKFDLFFSISRTPSKAGTPSESEMFQNFLQEVVAGDSLGYETAWIAESHLSSEVQKRNAKPVIPHWQGEVGLNTDIFTLATQIFARTTQLEVGSAITNILCNGGPIAVAERVATWATLHGLNPNERRRVHLGFSGGRFEYMNRPYGIVPRNAVEEAAWPAMKGQIFWEAAEILVRLLKGETLCSDDIRQTILTRDNFRSDQDWARVQAAANTKTAAVEIDRRFNFEHLKIVPEQFDRSLCQLIVGTHDPAVQADLNRHLPTRVFNLSITQPSIIEETHDRMRACYHPDGGAWQRDYMPRTTFVFIDESQSAAEERAHRALGAYWNALEGTIDPKKVQNAAANALIGDPATVAQQIEERFHPHDRLMLWFDFFDHNVNRVMDSMALFKHKVARGFEETR